MYCVATLSLIELDFAFYCFLTFPTSHAGGRACGQYVHLVEATERAMPRLGVEDVHVN